MAFSLETWKKKTVEQFHGFKTWMQKASINSVYAALSASAIWPIVEAARTEPALAYTALGGVLAGVGGNLLANMLQSL